MGPRFGGGDISTQPENGQQYEAGSLVGTVIDGLSVTKLLGAGGMGEVYLALQQRLGIPRALKVIKADLAGEAAGSRFRHEAIALGKLHHNNIIQVVDFGELPNGWPYLTMEYIEGEDLESFVETRGPMPLCDGVLVLRQLIAALSYAHSQGIVHRDLKPSNVILRFADPAQVKIIDFGLVKVLSDHEMTKLTGEGQLLGSPTYMAPEQAGGYEAAPTMDVYAVAGVAYYIFSGVPVFDESALLALLAAHASREPTSLKLRRPDLPERLDALLLACLSKKPEERPSTDELAFHFDRLHAELLASSLRPAPVSAAPGPPAQTPQGSAMQRIPTPATPPRASSSADASAPRRDTIKSLAPMASPSEASRVDVSRAGSQTLDPWEIHRRLESQASLHDGRDVRAATFNQLNAVLIELATKIVNGGQSRFERIAEKLELVEKVQSSISDLGIDLALLEADAATDPAAASTVESLKERIGGLQLSHWRGVRELFAEVMARRNDLRSAEVQGLREELQRLVERYITLASGSAAE